jgi:hypothetical protein
MLARNVRRSITGSSLAVSSRRDGAGGQRDDLTPSQWRPSDLVA